MSDAEVRARGEMKEKELAMTQRTKWWLLVKCRRRWAGGWLGCFLDDGHGRCYVFLFSYQFTSELLSIFTFDMSHLRRWLMYTHDSYFIFCFIFCFIYFDWQMADLYIFDARLILMDDSCTTHDFCYTTQPHSWFMLSIFIFSIFHFIYKSYSRLACSVASL